jgi:hypothetical protein
LSPSASSASKLGTAITSASSPFAGVPTVPPSPRTHSGCAAGRIMVASSKPRIQVGTFTSSVRTFSCPSASSALFAHPMARAIAGEPLGRAPTRSQRCASFFQAPSSVMAASMIRVAVAR